MNVGGAPLTEFRTVMNPEVSCPCRQSHLFPKEKRLLISPPPRWGALVSKFRDHNVCINKLMWYPNILAFFLWDFPEAFSSGTLCEQRGSHPGESGMEVKMCVSACGCSKCLPLSCMKALFHIKLLSVCVLCGYLVPCRDSGDGYGGFVGEAGGQEEGEDLWMTSLAQKKGVH